MLATHQCSKPCISNVLILVQDDVERSGLTTLSRSAIQPTNMKFSFTFALALSLMAEAHTIFQASRFEVLTLLDFLANFSTESFRQWCRPRLSRRTTRSKQQQSSL